MIRKLRWKFVMINMSIVTIMLCVILGLVYHFTKENVEANSINMMQNIANRPFGMEVPGERKEEVRLPYFMLQVEQDGQLEAAGGGYYDLSDEAFLEGLVKEVFDSKKELGLIEEYNLRFYRILTPRFQRIVFADISNELATLKGLMQICSVIGGFSFLMFTWISILLARWAVKPVDLAWKQQRQFVADASHELKTPLTVIMTNAELMQSMDYDMENKKHFLENILLMSRQMRKLIEQMLELARTDNIPNITLGSGGNSFRQAALWQGIIRGRGAKAVRETIDLSKLVCDSMLPFEPVFFEKGLTLTTQVEDHIHVSGEGAQLRQVVEILLDNAAKYSKADGITWITLKEQGKRYCLLTVADEGDEILPEDLKNLFKRFYRANKARNQAGSFGLGLSIAQNIIKQHRGKIWAESKDGVNSFYVQLRTVRRRKNKHFSQNL